MSNYNRLANCHNRFQDTLAFPRTLCLCSAGMLRSPTIAFVLSNPPYNRNTRAAGVAAEYALVPVDSVLIEWADEIVCAEKCHNAALIDLLKEKEDKPAVYCLDIPDSHKFRDPRLIKAIQAALERVGFPKYQGQ